MPLSRTSLSFQIQHVIHWNVDSCPRRWHSLVGKSKGEQAQINLRIFLTLPQPQLSCLENATLTVSPVACWEDQIKWSQMCEAVSTGLGP